MGYFINQVWIKQPFKFEMMVNDVCLLSIPLDKYMVDHNMDKYTDIYFVLYHVSLRVKSG